MLGVELSRREVSGLSPGLGDAGGAQLAPGAPARAELLTGRAVLASA